MARAEKLRPQHGGEADRSCADDEHGCAARHLAPCRRRAGRRPAARPSRLRGTRRSPEACSRCSRRCAHTRHRRLATAPSPTLNILVQVPRKPKLMHGRMVAAADDGETGQPIARLPQMLDGTADLDHLAGEFVAHDRAERERHGRRRLRHVQVRAADAAILYFQDDVVRARLGIGDRFDDERLGHFLEHGGTHGASSIFSGQAWRKPMSSATQEENGGEMTDVYATAREMIADLKAKKVSARELLDRACGAQRQGRQDDQRRRRNRSLRGR